MTIKLRYKKMTEGSHKSLSSSHKGNAPNLKSFIFFKAAGFVNLNNDSIFKELIICLEDYISEVYCGPTINIMVYKYREKFKTLSYERWAAIECLDYIFNSDIDNSSAFSIKESVNKAFNNFHKSMCSEFIKTHRDIYRIAAYVSDDILWIANDILDADYIV